MAKQIKLTTIILTILFSLSLFIYFFTSLSFFKTLAITFGTSFYHFAIRLLIGFCYKLKFNDKIDYNRSWFKAKNFESKLYKNIKVKLWKKYLPTYQIGSFNLKTKTYEQIAMSTCQAEIVHETIVLFSFIPILFSIWFGAIWVFVITSVLAAIFDTLFVIIQRYNRPRIVKLINKGKM